MNSADLTRFIRQEIARQMNILLSGQAANATNFAEDIQTLFPGMNGILQRPVMHPYGFCSLAPDGTISVTARQGEHAGNRMVLGHRAADRPDDLEEGETCAYSSSGYRLVWKQGMILIGKGEELEPAVMGATLQEFLSQLLNAILGHTHASPGSPPTNAETFEDLLTNFIENGKILAEDGGRF